MRGTSAAFRCLLSQAFGLSPALLADERERSFQFHSKNLAVRCGARGFPLEELNYFVSAAESTSTPSHRTLFGPL
jgi:hypothetical protein